MNVEGEYWTCCIPISKESELPEISPVSIFILSNSFLSASFKADKKQKQRDWRSQTPKHIQRIRLCCYHYEGELVAPLLVTWVSALCFRLLVHLYLSDQSKQHWIHQNFTIKVLSCVEQSKELYFIVLKSNWDSWINQNIVETNYPIKLLSCVGRTEQRSLLLSFWNETTSNRVETCLISYFLL